MSDQPQTLEEYENSPAGRFVRYRTGRWRSEQTYEIYEWKWGLVCTLVEEPDLVALTDDAYFRTCIAGELVDLLCIWDAEAGIDSMQNIRDEIKRRVPQGNQRWFAPDLTWVLEHPRYAEARNRAFTDVGAYEAAWRKRSAELLAKCAERVARSRASQGLPPA